MPTDYHNSFNLGEEVIWEPDVNYPLSYLIDRGDYWAWNNTYTSWLRNGGSSSGTAIGSNLGKLFRLDNRTLVLLVGCGAAGAIAEALEICESTGRYQLADFSQWSDLFYTHNQNGRLPGLKEAIFYENLRETSSRWRWNMVNDFRPQLINASGVKCWPTANYVDYYGMANGMPINDITKKDAESGYDPEYPWKGRDPRFYKDIIFDGVKCCTNGKGDMKETKQYASLYTGGSYRVDTKGCLTGYMNTKFCPQLTNDYDGYRENNCMVLSFMRLADVYLMYAEATAQGYGSPTSKVNGYGLSAADAVNKVRDRAGVGHVADKFLASLDGFMSELRRERAVELAFEGHRFVDLRRWMLLTERPCTLKRPYSSTATPRA